MTSDKIIDMTALVGLYGTLRPHPWIAANADPQDAYSLFRVHATAMGWSASGPDGIGATVWGMNDAGQAGSGEERRIGWFQVGLDKTEGALPLVPLAVCAWKSLARIGMMDVDAVQLLVPVHEAAPAWTHLVSTRSWFTTADPAARVHAEVVLDPGADETGEQTSAAVVNGMQAISIKPFAVAPVPDRRPVANLACEPALVGDLWMGPTRNPITLDAELPEWTPEAIGWLTSLVTEGMNKAGITTSTLISIVRQPFPGAGEGSPPAGG